MACFVWFKYIKSHKISHQFEEILLFRIFIFLGTLELSLNKFCQNMEACVGWSWVMIYDSLIFSPSTSIFLFSLQKMKRRFRWADHFFSQNQSCSIISRKNIRMKEYLFSFRKILLRNWKLANFVPRKRNFWEKKFGLADCITSIKNSTIWPSKRIISKIL